MNRSVRTILFGIGWFACCVITISLWKGSALALWFDPIVCILCVVTLIRGPWVGLCLALSAGIISDLVTIWPFGVHVLAGMISVGAVSLLSRFWLTGRSGASFFFLVPIGTLAYALALGLLVSGIHVLSPTSIVPDWNLFIQSAFLQALVHACVGLFILRFRRTQYSRTRLQHQF